MEHISLYKVGVVLSVEEAGGKKGGKALKICSVNIGGDEGGNDDGDVSALMIVTSAPNVRDGSRVVVAPVGSIIITDDGEEMTVKATSVGGVMSQGMLCDSKMLGWSGGAAGIAVQVPEDIPIGATPPASKPRPGGSGAAAAAGAQEEVPTAGSAGGGLYERKLTKEEKKKLAAEKRAAKKAAKAAAASSES